jgi:nucleoside-diphosphate-sugar epimerase
MPDKFSIIFGTGPLGKAVMKSLLRRGKRVRMVNRSGSANVPAEVEVLAGDANDREFTRQVIKDAEVVFQCAQPAYHEWLEKFPSFQAAILEGAAANGSKFIAAENLYMYGEVSGPIHEDLPYAARTRKGRVRAEMAAVLLEAHRSGKARVAMARGADFYGPEVLGSSLGERAFGAAVKGKAASLIGALDLPHTYTYIQDFGEAMAVLSERDEALGQAWHVPNPPTLTQRELTQLFFDEIGRPAKMSGMGRTMMALGGLFVKEAGEMVEMMYEFEKPFVVDSGKFARAFGDLATPHDAAIKTTAAWYREWAAHQSK